MLGFRLLYDKKGVTLIEIIIILVILGILSTVALPNLLRFNNRWLLRSTAHMIANDIRLVQRQSVQECSYYNFELNTKEFYYILRNNHPLYPNIKKVFLDPRITSISSTLSSSPGYGGSAEGYRILRFSHLGSPNQAGTIILRTSDGDSIRLTIDVTTGRVKVYE